MKTEKQTRKDIIDQKLLQAGWRVGDPTQVVEEFEIDVDVDRVDRPWTTGEPPPASPYEGHQYSDYVLLGRGTQKSLPLSKPKKPLRMPLLVASRPSSIVKIFRNKRVASCRSAFTLTVWKPTSGISIITPRVTVQVK